MLLFCKSWVISARIFCFNVLSFVVVDIGFFSELVQTTGALLPVCFLGYVIIAIAFADINFEIIHTSHRSLRMVTVSGLFLTFLECYYFKFCIFYVYGLKFLLLSDDSRLYTNSSALPCNLGSNSRNFSLFVQSSCAATSFNRL